MLTREENELLTRVGPGTSMGELMRRFWIPTCLVDELPEPDCDPIQIRLLGEDLVAFRDSSGRVGVMEEHCPHRGASLFYGRNEQGGLRCLYHGWKIAVDGRVLDTPCEPTTRPFRHRAFPVVEQGDVVWTYMGPPNNQPSFPNFPWTTMPAERRCVGKIDYACNYLQAIEGAIDSSHAELLHSGYQVLGWTDERINKLAPEFARVRTTSWETADTPYGFRYAAIRPHPADPERSRALRITEFAVPFHCLLHPAPHMFVPADDDSTWFYDVRTSEKAPIDRAATRAERGERVGIDIGRDRHKVRTSADHYQQNRQAMRARADVWSYSGIQWGKPLQDMCVIESMGPTYDRTKEHLGLQDVGVAQMRQRMLTAVRHFMKTGDVAELDPSIPYERIGGNAYVVSNETPWDAATTLMREPASTAS